MLETGLPAARVAVIGTGAIGSAVVRRLLSGGHEVVVWNRTASRITGLVGAGAVPVRSVQEAVSAGPLSLLTLKDYTAVRECLGGLDLDLSGRTIVVMCTGSPADAQLAADRVAGLGGRYLDAGVQTSPEMIGTETATILYSGSVSGFEEHAPTLALLSKPRFVAEAPEAAAVWDLVLFGLWYDAQVGLLRALDTIREAGIDTTEFAATAATQLGHVVSAIPDTVSELRRATYPRGPADLTEHLSVIRQLLALRAGRPLGDGGLPEVATRIEALIDGGHAEVGLTATVGRW